MPGKQSHGFMRSEITSCPQAIAALPHAPKTGQVARHAYIVVAANPWSPNEVVTIFHAELLITAHRRLRIPRVRAIIVTINPDQRFRNKIECPALGEPHSVFCILKTMDIRIKQHIRTAGLPANQDQLRAIAAYASRQEIFEDIPTVDGNMHHRIITRMVDATTSNRYGSQGAGLENTKLGLELARQPLIIIIEKTNVSRVGRGSTNTNVAGIRGTARLAIADIVNPWIGETPDNIARPVRGSIIHDEELPVAIGLIKDTANCAADQMASVVCRQNNGDRFASQ